MRRELDRGGNFVRPSVVEVEAAERFLATVPTAEMVKFAKNGSDATTAAVRLARAATGRPRVALCADHPFFSVDDWFIGTTPMSAGVPAATTDLTVAFPYGDLAATEELLTRYEGEVACLILEPATHTEPPPGYLAGLRALADRHGCVLVFDEMITGFRWSEAGAQGLYGVVPRPLHVRQGAGQRVRRLSALAGRRELLERGGLRHSGERVFLLSTTHGAETHSLAAAMAVQTTYVEEGVTARLPRPRRSNWPPVSARPRPAMGVGDHVVSPGRVTKMDEYAGRSHPSTTGSGGDACLYRSCSCDGASCRPGCGGDGPRVTGLS
ncbi:hypothetical protein GCM10023238_35330 [Streptomyces heliomycini]